MDYVIFPTNFFIVDEEVRYKRSGGVGINHSNKLSNITGSGGSSGRGMTYIDSSTTVSDGAKSITHHHKYSHRYGFGVAYLFFGRNDHEGFFGSLELDPLLESLVDIEEPEGVYAYVYVDVCTYARVSVATQ